MRQLNLNIDWQAGDFVQGLKSSATFTLPPFVQGDTLQLGITELAPAPDDGTTDTYVANPWSFTGLRASLGLIDAPPEKGSFCFVVDGETSSALTWPTDLSTGGLSDWKKLALAALNAVAGTGAARLDDPVNAPSNFFFFTWTDPADDRVISVANVELVPPVQVVIEPLQGTPAYQQVVKIVQLPIVMATDFAFPDSPLPAITRDRAGSTSGNEIQLLFVSQNSVGAFDLGWSGAVTAAISVTSLSASAIQTALNAIVTGGTSNPSFSVTERTASDGRKFAIEFVGPLAAASQTLLTANALDQSPATTAYGTLPLTSPRFERAIAGQASVPMQFELVKVDAGGEATILKLVTVVNDMTDGSTVTSAEEAGSVLRVEKPVYIDTATNPQPTITAAPGFTVTASGEGNALVITHGLNTWRPRINVTLYAVDHTTFAADPTNLTAALTGSRTLKDTEYGETATTANIVHIALPFDLVDDPTSTLDYRLLAVDVSSPDAVLQLWSNQNLWDDCKDTLPSGQSVRAALAALQTAFGMLDGGLPVGAAQITGLIEPDQIDLPALAAALLNVAAFASTINSLLATNSTLIATIAKALAASTDFIATLISIFGSNNDVITAIVNSELNNSTFNSTIQSVVLSVLQGGLNLPGNASPILIPDVVLVLPAPQTIRSASKSISVPVQTSTTSGSTTTTSTENEVVLTPTDTPRYCALPSALTGGTDGGSLTGALSPTTDQTKFYTVGSGGASFDSARRRRGHWFSAGKKIVNQGGFWYEVIQIGDIWYPVEMERELAFVGLDDEMFFPGTQLVFNGSPSLTLNSTSGVRGRVALILQTGAFNQAAGDDLSTITWTTIASTIVWLSRATVFRKFGVTAQHAAGGALTGTYTFAGKPTASFTPPSANFAVRLAMTKFDTINDPDPRGSLAVNLTGALASVAPL